MSILTSRASVSVTADGAIDVIAVGDVRVSWHADDSSNRRMIPPPRRQEVTECRSPTAAVKEGGISDLPWCTTPIEAESSLGPDSHHPIISLSGIPSAVMVLRILHPILASTLCAANPLARIALRYSLSTRWSSAW